MRPTYRPAFVILLAVVLARSAAAATVTLDAFDAGNLRGPTAGATFVGPLWATFDDNPGDFRCRNYFKFDLSGIAAGTVVTSAYLVLEVPLGSYESKEDYELLELYDFTSDPDLLGYDFGTHAARAFDLAVWTDLGDGDLYGKRRFTAADEGTSLRIPLNATAIADINAAIGDEEFVIGGRLSKTPHADYPTAVPTDPDRILDNTGDVDDYLTRDIIPTSWSTRQLVLVTEP